MARLLIRQANGGRYLTISDAALPFFQSQGYVVIDTIDDSGDTPPLYLSKEESDARYAKLGAHTPVVVHGTDADAARPAVNGPVIWFGTVDPVNADDTQDVTVYVSADDGSVGGGGGGTGGAVDSVNGKVGVVVLSADDLADGTAKKMMTAAERTKLAGLSTTIPVSAVTGLQAALDAKAAASTTPRILPYSATLPTRPNYAGPVIIQIPDSIKGTVTFGGTTAGGTTALVNNLDHVWTS